MSYIGSPPTIGAFPFDQFSGNNLATTFTLTYAPAGSSSVIVTVSGITQNPNNYSIQGTTLTFTGVPPTGTNNIFVLYLGLPVIAVTTPGNTAYRTPQDITATLGQTTFTTLSAYTPGFVEVLRNGVRLGDADFTAATGTTVVLNKGCLAGDLITIIYFTLTSIVNALPQSGGTILGNLAINGTTTINGAIGSGYTGMKNRIINGNMRINQRAFSGNITPSAEYTLDRWRGESNIANKFSVSQSTVAPAGFINSALITSLAATTLAATDYNLFYQSIEGFNTADLAWGTANAQTVTFSFLVRSSLTGTFGGVINNGDSTRSYPFTYVISAANTTEQKTITIPGDTAGTWLTNNGRGAIIRFGLGVGTTYSGPAGAWAGATYFSATGATNFVGTSGATLYITGVQLERGSNATSYEFRDYASEFARCQRYYEVTTYDGSLYALMSSALNTFTNQWMMFNYKQTKRVVPTFAVVSGVWTTSTPTVNPGIDKCTFNSTAVYYLQGVSGNTAASFNAEL